MDEYSKRLLEENLKLTKEIHKMTKKINNFVVWSRVLGFLKILIIIAPIVLGIIYFRPILGIFNTVIEPYKELLNLGGEGGSTLDLGNIDINQMSPELRKLIGQ